MVLAKYTPYGMNGVNTTMRTHIAECIALRMRMRRLRHQSITQDAQ